MNDIINLDILRDALIAAIPALICITVHELSHGFVAYKLGDNTAKDMGRLTLNPIKHIDIIGLAMILLVGFGWAKPVPVDLRNFERPKSYMALTALAGPLSNIILAFITMLIFMLLPFPYGGGGLETSTEGVYAFIIALSPGEIDVPLIAMIISRMAMLNVALAVFNLLPIPPLDGSKVLFSFLPEKAYYTVLRYERYGMILLLVLMVSGRFLNFNILNILIGRPTNSLLIGIAEFTSGIVT